MNATISAITTTGTISSLATTARGRAVCAAPAAVRVVPSHATAACIVETTFVGTGVVARFGWAPMSARVQAPFGLSVQAGTRGAVDLKAGLAAAPTTYPGHRTWSPPL